MDVRAFVLRLGVWSLALVAAGGISVVQALDIATLREKAKTLQPQLQTGQAEGADLAADNSVDPERYFVGPGDGFEISMVDVPSFSFRGDINHSGELFIPSVGLIELGRIPLAEAVDTLAAFVKGRTEQAGQVFVSLSSMKRVSVSVAGAVSAPGTYSLPGNFRLLDLIRRANHNALPGFDVVDYRDVRVRNPRGDGSFDLLSYILVDSLTQNPYLYPGDNVSIKRATNRVFINGAIRSPVMGLVAIRKGETLAEFLRLFPFDACADPNHIIVYKNSGNRVTIRGSDELANTVLEDGDAVTVSQKANYGEYLFVTIAGEIARPGRYPIQEERTKFSDLVSMAGGVGPNGDEMSMFVIRSEKVLDNNVATNMGGPSHLSAVLRPEITSIRPSINSALYRLALLGDHTVIPVSQTDQGILLRDGDHIVIPPHETRVYVSGHVRSPGSYAYDESLRPRRYIGLAGGLTGKADRHNLFVIRKYGSKLQLRELETLEAGDVIVVPEREQFRGWTLFRDVVSVAAGLASVVWTAVLVSSTIGSSVRSE